jgi:hypothetical protein
MSYYLPAIRLLPSDSLFVQRLTSTSYDRGLTAKRATGDFFIPPSEIIKHTINYIIKELQIARFNLNQLCAQASYAPGARPPHWRASGWLFHLAF